ncbi:hypothetical protein JKG47_02860 [Acidithiobacillus sp. MC6.1]|nr:hypothetical protein [Acidithiobacillus sp. MC6.1]
MSKISGVVMMMLPVYMFSTDLAMAATPSGTSNTQAATATLSQLQQTRGDQVAVASVNTDLRVFAMSAAAYVYENTGGVAWNQQQSTTPVAYAPFLIYAGNNASVCGFSGGTGKSTGFSNVNVASANGAHVYNGSNAAPYQYLPSTWKPAMGGTYCAVVWLNSPGAQESAMSIYYVTPKGAKSILNNLTITPTSLVYKVGQSPTLTKAFPNSQPMWSPTGGGSFHSMSGQPMGAG